MTIEKDFQLMIELQNKLNSYVNPDWKAAKQDWIRAAWIECAELMDHIGWKWWKQQIPNIPQAQIELVDIFHFLLSQSLVDNVDTEVLIEAYEYSENLHRDWKSESNFNTLAGIEILVFDLMTDGHHGCYYEDFFALCKELDLSFESLVKQYISKNVLNIFRQDKGYKTGDYIKEWPSPIEPNKLVEDNVFLEMFMGEANAIGLEGKELFDYVYGRLVESYPN